MHKSLLYLTKTTTSILHTGLLSAWMICLFSSSNIMNATGRRGTSFFQVKSQLCFIICGLTTLSVLPSAQAFATRTRHYSSYNRNARGKGLPTSIEATEVQGQPRYCRHSLQKTGSPIIVNGKMAIFVVSLRVKIFFKDN